MTWGNKNVNHGYWSVPSKTAIKKVPFWELIGSVGQPSGTAVRTLAESTWMSKWTHAKPVHSVVKYLNI